MERAILQMMLDVHFEVPSYTQFFLDLQSLTLLAQVRTNAMHMVIAVAQLGASQMRHMVKHVHGCVCQMVFNCMNGAFEHLQNLAQDSEEFAELTLVIAIHAALLSKTQHFYNSSGHRCIILPCPATGSHQSTNRPTRYRAATENY